MERLSGATEVGEYNIPISRKGAPLKVDKLNFDNIFVSRNYKIEEKPGTLKVNPREITVKADDVNGTYGIEPKYSYTIEGLASFDAKETAVEAGANAVLDDKKASGSYTQLVPGKYENVLIPPSKATKNYKIVESLPGNLNMRKIIKIAMGNQQYAKKTILFLDEIHRWNKAQQDALLPYAH